MNSILPNNLDYNKLISNLGQASRNLSRKGWETLEHWSLSSLSFLTKHRSAITANVLFLAVIGSLVAKFEQALNQRFPSHRKIHFALTTGFLGTAIAALNHLCFGRTSSALSRTTMAGIAVTCMTLYILLKPRAAAHSPHLPSMPSLPQHHQKGNCPSLSNEEQAINATHSYSHDTQDPSPLKSTIPSPNPSMDSIPQEDTEPRLPFLNPSSEMLSLSRASSAPLPVSTPFHSQRAPQQLLTRAATPRQFTPKKQGITIEPMQAPELNQKDIDPIEEKALADLNALQKQKEDIQKLETRYKSLEDEFHRILKSKNRDTLAMRHASEQMRETQNDLEQLKGKQSEIDEKLKAQVQLLEMIRQKKSLAQPSDAPSAPGTPQALLRQMLLQTASPVVDLSAFSTRPSPVNRNLSSDFAAIASTEPSSPPQQDEELSQEELPDPLNDMVSLKDLLSDPNFEFDPDYVYTDHDGNPVVLMKIDNQIHYVTQEGECYNLDGDYVGELTEEYFNALFPENEESPQ